MWARHSGRRGCQGVCLAALRDFGASLTPPLDFLKEALHARALTNPRKDDTFPAQLLPLLE